MENIPVILHNLRTIYLKIKFVTTLMTYQGLALINQNFLHQLESGLIGVLHWY